MDHNRYSLSELEMLKIENEELDKLVLELNDRLEVTNRELQYLQSSILRYDGCCNKVKHTNIN